MGIFLNREERVYSVLLTSALRKDSLYLIYTTPGKPAPDPEKTVLAVGTIIDKTLLKELESRKD